MSIPAPRSDAEIAADAALYRDALHGLIRHGMALAERLEALPADEAAAAFDAVARGVRKCVLLARSLDLAPAQQRVAAVKRQVLRGAEDAIGRECGHGAEAEGLRAELAERLDAPEFPEELGDRPAEDVLRDICRDLGLGALPGTRPWLRRRPADIAALHARARGGAAPALATLAEGLAAERPGRLLPAARFRGK